MKIILANAAELTPILVRGESRYVHSAHRDTLTFIFPAETSLDELDALFTAANCEDIIIDSDDTHAIHHGYTIRAELKRAPVVVIPATAETDAVTENRVSVSMSQRTYMETQVAKLNAAVNRVLVETIE